MRAAATLGFVALNACAQAERVELDTPEQAIARTSSFAEKREWRAYWDGFSERGRGWLIGEAATALAWGAYAQPINPELGKPYHEVIVKYGLQKQRLEPREGESIDEACLRASRSIGECGPALCAEFFGVMKAELFPKRRADRVEIAGERARAIFEDVPYGLVRINGRWFLDGGFAD